MCEFICVLPVVVSWLLYGIDRRLVEVGSSVTVLGPAAQACGTQNTRHTKNNNNSTSHVRAVASLPPLLS